MVGKERFKGIPVAVTPISFGDIYYALIHSTDDSAVYKFKDAIKSYLDAKYAYTFTSFMRAIYALLISLKKIDKRREVLIQRYSCPSFAHAILAAGLKIKYCDTDSRTLTFDIECLNKTDLKNTLALISVNHFGLMNPMDELLELREKYDFYLIEDLGYSLGSEFKNKKLGTYGDFSILNFQEGKAIPIGGGMVISREMNLEELDEKHRKQTKNLIPLIRSIGYRALSVPHSYFLFMKISEVLGTDIRIKFSMEDTIRDTESEYDYSFDENSIMYYISNFHAALGLRIFPKKFEEHMKIRENNAKILEEELENINGVTLIEKIPGSTKIHYIRYPILIDKKKRDQAITELRKQGIETSPMYVVHGMKVDPNEFPGAAKVADEILTLPCHPKVTEGDLMRIVKTLKKVSLS